MGVHVGETIRHGREVVGREVNLAARIGASAAPGEVARLAGFSGTSSPPPRGSASAPRGQPRFKGFSDEHVVHRSRGVRMRARPPEHMDLRPRQLHDLQLQLECKGVVYVDPLVRIPGDEPDGIEGLQIVRYPDGSYRMLAAQDVDAELYARAMRVGADAEL